MGIIIYISYLMGKSKKRDEQNGGDRDSSNSTIKKRKRKEVQVVVCPSAFPDFTTVGGSTSRRREQQRRGGGGIANRIIDNSTDSTVGPALDVQETIREIHKFGAEGFTGKQKKSHEAAEYERLTGRTIKRHKMPTKIVVGMRGKAKKREERQEQELKESGVVSHYSTNSGSAAAATLLSGSSKKKKSRRSNNEDDDKVVQSVFKSNRSRNKGDRRSMDKYDFGPNPDVGFLHKGMLKVKQPRTRR